MESVSHPSDGITVVIFLRFWLPKLAFIIAKFSLPDDVPRSVMKRLRSKCQAQLVEPLENQEAELRPTQIFEIIIPVFPTKNTAHHLLRSKI